MAKPNANWTARPSNEDMQQVEELLEILAQTKVDGVGMTLNFISRRIQPCKERVHPTYEFYDEDFVREAPERLERSEFAVCASKFFASNTIIKNKGQPMAYSLGNPRPNVS